jgi:hypothetical protein
VTDQHLFIGNLNPAAGREAEFNSWYEIHVREVVDNIDGFTAGQRYRLSEAQRSDSKPSPWRFLTIYELEGDDVDEIHRANTVVRESGIYMPYDGLIEDDNVAYVFTPVGPRHCPGDWSGRADAAHVTVVRSSPSPGREDEYNAWYDNHVREVVGNIDGYEAAQRYRLNPSQRPGMPPSPWEYTVVYDVSEPDLEKVFRSNFEARERGAFTPHDGALADHYIGHVFTPVGARVTSTAGVAAV